MSLGTFFLSSQVEPGSPPCQVLVVSHADSMYSGVEGVRLWVLFSFKQGLEGPAANLLTNGSGEDVSQLTQILQESPLPLDSPHGPFYYEGLEAVLHGSVLSLLAEAQAQNRELEARLASFMASLGVTYN